MRALLRGVALCAALLPCQAVLAQDITLTARNGGLSLTGQFRGYDGAFYRIETEFGPLTVDAEGVICDGPACPDLIAPMAEIRIVGAAEAAAALLPDLFAGFAASRGLRLSVATQGAEFAAEILDPEGGQVLARIGFSALDRVAAQAAVMARAADLVLDFGDMPGLRARALALEALVPLIAAENLLPTIRSADLAAALQGEIQNWQALGGADMPIVVHGLHPGHPLQAAIEARLGGPLATGPRHADLATLERAVARDPWALALTGISGATPAGGGAARPAGAGPARSPVLTDGCDFPRPATPLAVKAEDYPLTVPLFLLSPPRRLPLLTREFLEYLATDSAQQVVAGAGLVDRRPGRAALTEDGQRLLGAIRNAGPEVPLQELQRLAAAMTGGERLSLTFRFQDGSAELDAHSRQNLEDLARWIGAGGFAGERLTLAGFTDGTGAHEVNLALSRSRADAVRAALRAIAPELTDPQIPVVDAFGEALPMACDTTPAGRQVNRRVELWAHPLPQQTGNEKADGTSP
ncbi:OmpA family protein [Szabonella alba]|uniref:OmpA family protein n=1 Tax=Szabonella alba TaxID=2804194 RepID=A0A8K0V8R3_9RHOB|nr:phosphate ABC transporter substrate-binding/OmpA family protein [Szabonella alba]MBL4915763.1 OmpA family protein [Szabonella alba]